MATTASPAAIRAPDGGAKRNSPWSKTTQRTPSRSWDTVSSTGVCRSGWPVPAHERDSSPLRLRRKRLGLIVTVCPCARCAAAIGSSRARRDVDGAPTRGWSNARGAGRSRRVAGWRAPAGPDPGRHDPGQREGDHRRCPRHGGRGRRHQWRPHRGRGHARPTSSHAPAAPRRSSTWAAAPSPQASSTRTSTSPRSTRSSASTSAISVIKSMKDVQARVAAAGGQGQARRVGDRRRLGRGQAGGAASHHCRRPRRRGSEQPGVARQHHRPLRRRQQLRHEDRRDPQGHARPVGRHHRARGRRRPQRRAARSRAAAHHPPRAAADARAAEGGHRPDRRGLQQGRHDRREGSGHQPAQVGALQRAAARRETDGAGVRACGRARAGPKTPRPCWRGSTPIPVRRRRSATACCSRAA